MGAKILTLSLTLLMMSCGDISLKPGSGLSLTEPLPPGSTLVNQGTFSTGSATITVSGSAQIYQASNGDAILRLAGFSTNTAGLFAFVETGNDLAFYVTPLKATSGQMNYLTGKAVAGSVFSRIVLRQTGNVNSVEISSATLLPVQ